MNYYWKHPHEEENVETFKRLVRANPDLIFFQPSPRLAPWHVQTEIRGVLINFWPHRMKGQRMDGKARTGYGALQRLIDQAKNDRDFHVID